MARSVEAGAVARAREIESGIVTVALVDAVGAVRRRIAVVAPKRAFVARFAEAKEFTGRFGTAFATTPASISEFGTGTRLVTLFAEVT